MSTPPRDPGADDLEAALRDLGAHLDLGPGDTDAGRAALVGSVLERLDDPVAAPSDVAGLSGLRRRRLVRRLLTAAAVVVVVLAGLLTVTPTREAIARWLGIGAISITGGDPSRPDGEDPAPGAPSDDTTPVDADLEATLAALPFPLLVPDTELTGALVDAETDPAVPVGLVELRYDGVTLVEVGSRHDAPPVLGKVVGPGTTVTTVTVRGRDGRWLTGDPHQVASMDPDGNVRTDTVRRAGDVLIWEEDGVTIRIEGAPSLDAALAIAASMR